MKIRVDIGRLLFHDQSLSRAQRLRLQDDIGREIARRLAGDQSTPRGDHRPVVPSVPAQIAAAVVAQLPTPPATPATGRRP